MQQRPSGTPSFRRPVAKGIAAGENVPHDLLRLTNMAHKPSANFFHHLPEARSFAYHGLTLAAGLDTF
ncbi:MAG: hypothetical protein ACLQOO_30140 [Terriglobia bacterium]